MRYIFAVFAFGLAGCVTGAGHSTMAMSNATVVHTIRCEKHWDGC